MVCLVETHEERDCFYYATITLSIFIEARNKPKSLGKIYFFKDEQRTNKPATTYPSGLKGAPFVNKALMSKPSFWAFSQAASSYDSVSSSLGSTCRS